MQPVTLKPNSDTATLRLKSNRKLTVAAVDLSIRGLAAVASEPYVRQAVAADDRMQAFLWRHLVPAQSMTAVVLSQKSANAHGRPVPRPAQSDETVGQEALPPKFGQQQIDRRLKLLRDLFNEWLLTDDFYLEKVAEWSTETLFAK